MVQKKEGATPTIVVIIRAFNAESFLEEAFQSLLDQTSEANIIIRILSDLGSTDNTLQLSREISSRKVSRVSIQLIEHQHASPFRALLNFGLDKLDGDFFTFLDYDNKFPPYYLEGVVDLMVSGKYDFLFSNPRIFNEDGDQEMLVRDMPDDLKKLARLQMWSNRIDINAIVLSKKGADLVASRLKSLSFQSYDWIYEDWVIGNISILELRYTFTDAFSIKYRAHSQNITFGSQDLVKGISHKQRLLLSRFAISTTEYSKLGIMNRTLLFLGIVNNILRLWRMGASLNRRISGKSV